MRDRRCLVKISKCDRTENQTESSRMLDPVCGELRISAIFAKAKSERPEIDVGSFNRFKAFSYSLVMFLRRVNGKISTSA